ncbi:MAG: gamma-glutamyltransferase [Aggregatilineales bacterium]
MTAGPVLSAENIWDFTDPTPELEGRAHRTVWGRNGAVASADQMASLVGIRILEAGGNAVDAAVAMAAALNVVEPYMSGIGGTGGYMHIWIASEGRSVILDSIGTSPADADLGSLTEADCDQGYRACIVPGDVAGWAAALKRYGTMALADLLQPAIRLASEGIAVSHYDALWFAAHVAKLGAYSETARVYLPNGHPPKAGEIFRQPDLARSLEKVAAGGAEVFYQGDLAHQIVNHLQSNGGLMSMADLANFRVQWRDPIRIEFRGHALFGVPPGSTAMTMFQVLNILEGFDLEAMDPFGATLSHIFLEAFKLALEDDNTYNTGKHDRVPVQKLISKAHAADQRKRIDLTGVGFNGGGPLPTNGTTTLSVVDRDGNMVAFTFSHTDPFGSGVVAGDTGILLNNGHRYGFVLEADHVNQFEGGRKAKGVMCPTVAAKDGHAVLAVGAAGGYTIPQTVAQVLIRTLVYQMDLQQAISAPRLTVNRPGGRVPTMGSSSVYMDRMFPILARSGLEELGHSFATYGNSGGVQAVSRIPGSRVMGAAADSRRDGHAIVA